MIVEYADSFEREVRKIKHQGIKLKIKKHIAKITINPETGKPMRFDRKDTREVHISSYRLSYSYSKEEDKLVFLDLYHKDEQ